MLVIQQAKTLALKLNDPSRVTETIPTAKTLSVRGQNVVAVPHKLDEVRVLNALGIEAPSPIGYYYKWKGRFTPYEHQEETAAFLTMHKKAIVLNDIGTGKTQSALWAADYLMEIGEVRKVLIMSPLSTLERVWGDAIFTGFVERAHVTLHGTSQRRLKRLKADVDFYIINHDGFPIIADHCINMFDLVIVDEAAVLRNPSTQRYKLLAKWMRHNPNTRLWLMTGTPTPNEPSDAWALATLIESPYIPDRYRAFRDQVMMQLNKYTWVPRPQSAETVMHVLQPSIRYSRDECVDLPDTIVQTRTADLTPMQRKYYDIMMKKFVAEIEEDGNTITAANEAIKLQKLIQISCGVAYDEDGSTVELDCAPRVSLVREVIEETNEKIIVFVPLTGTLRMLERELSKHWTVGVVNGEVSANERNIIFNNFQNGKDPRVLIAHPATMAHGLTLTAASTIIWYGPITSNEIYVQANGRVERIGKRHVSNVVHIESTPLEHKMYKRLENKQKLQGLILDLIEEQRTM